MRALSVWGLVILGLLETASASADVEFTSVDFPSAGIRARADLYGPSDPSAPLIVQFHQAGWSRGEYREIAPKLVAAGYRVLAVDLRSGRGVNGVANETYRRAAKRKLQTAYLDAYPDLVAALQYATQTLRAPRVVVWGSSYSASLVLRLAAEHSDEVGAVLAFSPGEYFKEDKGPSYVQGFAKRISQPLFVTSAKMERNQVKPLFDAAPSEHKVLFTPASRGQHGARALWSKWPDHDVYWAAVNGFLRTYVPAGSD